MDFCRQFVGWDRAVISFDHRSLKSGTLFFPLMLSQTNRTDTINDLDASQLSVNQEVINIEDNPRARGTCCLDRILNSLVARRPPDQKNIRLCDFLGMYRHLIE